MYNLPGKLGGTNDAVVEEWNKLIVATYTSLYDDWGSRFIESHPDKLVNPLISNSVKWFGNPAEPRFCISEDAARKLSDWGVRGRHSYHNEYCEYVVVYRTDATGKLRPKRVEVTTELREFWLCMAKYDPGALRGSAEEIVGHSLEWSELYGPSVSDPATLSLAQREQKFNTHLGGGGGSASPNDPSLPINTSEHALFMSHPINGLDDLIYVVMFGARPRAVKKVNTVRPANIREIFVAENVAYLACRHADPAAAAGAQSNAWKGKAVAFADPLGMYILSFNDAGFEYQGQAIPPSWIRLGRGVAGLSQRLEFGPSDGEAAFLDDIEVVEGGERHPLNGGYDVVAALEVGPLVAVGDLTPPAQEEIQFVPGLDSPYDCSQAIVCANIRNNWEEYKQGRDKKIGPRLMGPG